MSVKPCPHCRSSIPGNLETCPHCGKMITPGVANLNIKRLIPIFILVDLVVVALLLKFLVFK